MVVSITLNLSPYETTEVSKPIHSFVQHIFFSCGQVLVRVLSRVFLREEIRYEENTASSLEAIWFYLSHGVPRRYSVDGLA
jgi:hypothetical protein